MTIYIVAAGAVGSIVFSILFLLMLIKGSSLKVPFIGMAAFVILMAAGVVLTMLGDKEDSPDTADKVSQAVESQGVEDTKGPESEGQEEESAPPEDGSYTVGDSVSMNDIVVTLVDVSESEGAQFATPDDGKVFVLCEFTIENNSKNDIGISSILSFEAYVDDYTTSMDLSAIMSSDKPQLDGSIAAGKKMNGVIGYSADKGWSSIEVRFRPDFWSGNEFLFTYKK